MRAGASTPTRHMCVWFFFPFFILCLHPQMPLPPVCACNRPTLSIRLGSHVNDLDTSPPAACLQRGQQRVPGQVRAGVPQTATVWVLWFARTNQDGGVGVFLTLMSSCITFASVLSGLLDGCWMRARLPVWDLRVGVGRQCRGPSTSSQRSKTANPKTEKCHCHSMHGEYQACMGHSTPPPTSLRTTSLRFSQAQI